MRVIHFEIGADNPERAVKFYTDAFGWKVEKWDSPDKEVEYWLVTTGPKDQPGIDGGIFRRPGPAKGNVINTIDVTSVDDSAKKITELGGKLAVPKMPIPGVGWLAYCEDSEGNVFGIMQSDINAK